MFITGFDSFQQNLTWYYIVALIVTLLAITIAFLFSLRNVDFDEDHVAAAVDVGETTEITETSGANASQGKKKSPAVMAEKVIKANMTPEQKKFEQEIRKKQLAEIYKLMQQETGKFGFETLAEVEEQMKMYQ